jgi:hypothetical protein
MNSYELYANIYIYIYIYANALKFQYTHIYFNLIKKKIKIDLRKINKIQFYIL